MNPLRGLLNRPLPPRVAIVQAELNRFRRPRYLEIGVHTGVLFLHVRAGAKVGVDPESHVPRWKRLAHPNTALRGRLVHATSDEYFASLRRDQRFDVVFIDGLHLWEQCLRDIEHALAHISDDGVVLVHDANPVTAASAERNPAHGGDWCGDVWKAIAHLRAHRADLVVETLDTDSGIGVIRWGENPDASSGLDVAALEYADLEARRGELLGLRMQ